MPLVSRTRVLMAMCCTLLLPEISMAQTAPTPAVKNPVSARWQLLSAQERQALSPLAEHWGSISETQRSKWLAIARNFDQLSPAEQQVMQTRMREWAALSPTQRNQARLNFNTFQSVPRDERKNRWDEYQNLSEEERRKLSAGALGPARTAAPSARPMASDRLVQPTVRTIPPAALPPRTPVDRHTLLPLPPAPSATPATAENPASSGSEATPARETSGS